MHQLVALTAIFLERERESRPSGCTTIHRRRCANLQTLDWNKLRLFLRVMYYASNFKKKPVEKSLRKIIVAMS